MRTLSKPSSPSPSRTQGRPTPSIFLCENSQLGGGRVPFAKSRACVCVCVPPRECCENGVDSNERDARNVEMSGRVSVLLFLLLVVVRAHRSFTPLHKSPPKEQLNVGLIVPHTSFGAREYIRAINNAVSGLQRSRGPRLDWLKKYTFAPQNVHNVPMKLTPSPTGSFFSRTYRPETKRVTRPRFSSFFFSITFHTYKQMELGTETKPVLSNARFRCRTISMETVTLDISIWK